MSEKTTKSDVLTWILSHKAGAEAVHLPLMYEVIEKVNRNEPKIEEIRAFVESLNFLLSQNDELVTDLMNMEVLNDRAEAGEMILATFSKDEIDTKQAQLLANRKQMLNVIENLW